MSKRGMATTQRLAKKMEDSGGVDDSVVEGDAAETSYFSAAMVTLFSCENLKKFAGGDERR